MYLINVRPDECQFLSPESTFTCPRPSPGACQRAAAGAADLVLTPYDILRLKNRLGLTSSEFLAKYTKKEINPKSALPLILLDFSQSSERCPFVETALCTVFAERPAICRLYPLGIACTLKDDKMVEECFLTPQTDAPAPPDPWTVAAWLAEQDFTALEADLNHQWMELLLSKCVPDSIKPDARMQALFAMVSYDLDKFRRFIFKTPFMEIFEIPSEASEPWKTDDLELLQFGFRYLRMMLGLECTLSISDEVRRNAFPSDPSIANLYLRF